MHCFNKIFYQFNIGLYFDEKEVGVPRDAFLKALLAEGVSARASGAQFLAKNPLYHEPEGFHKKIRYYPHFFIQRLR